MGDDISEKTGEGDDSKSRDMWDGAGERGNEAPGNGEDSDLTGIPGDGLLEDIGSAGEVLREGGSGEVLAVDIGVGGCAAGAVMP